MKNWKFYETSKKAYCYAILLCSLNVEIDGSLVGQLTTSRTHSLFRIHTLIYKNVVLKLT